MDRYKILTIVLAIIIGGFSGAYFSTEPALANDVCDKQYCISTSQKCDDIALNWSCEQISVDDCDHNTCSNSDLEENMP